MKKVKCILFLLLAVIVVLVLAGLVIVTRIQRGALPQYEGELKVRGLNAEVTIYRDERGMPHIYASDEHDLYYTTGYIMAQERLWFMDLIRRVTRGTLSEVLGKEMVETDKFLRSLRMSDKSKEVIAAEDPAILACLQAYADGVNSYISDAGRKLPPEFRILGYKPDPWKLEDMANIIGYMGWDLANHNLGSELFYYKLAQKLGTEKATELIPDWNPVDAVVFPDFKLSDSTLERVSALIASLDKLEKLGVATFSGSNNWAVSGNRTETGKPVLSNDMHLSFGVPGIWIQMHQVIQGKLNVTGVMVPGQPFVVCGHNEKIAWGMTNLMVDDIDLFEERINPENPGQYFFNGEWKDIVSRKEIINIKGGKKDSVIIRYTHRGPIISGFQNIEGASLSMKWSGYDYSDEIKTVYHLNRAGNWNDFRKAISNFRTVSQNIVYADVDGNIGLNTSGGIPVRAGNGSLVRNGQTGENDWKGYVPFDLLPSSFNPPDGSVSSANNKTVPDGYPWYISSNFEMPYRIDRIRQMIGEKEVLGIEDFKRMILDQHSDYAALLTPFILKLKDGKSGLNGTESAMLDTLAAWDYNMAAGMVAPTVFEFFTRSFARNLLADELGDLYNQIFGKTSDYYIYRILKTGPDKWVDNTNTPEIESLEDIIMKSYRDCISELIVNAGSNPERWAWGNIHTFTLQHPLGTVRPLDLTFGLNSKTYNVGGSWHTVCPYSYDKSFSVNHGASERHIFNTANWDESLTIIPTGISGVPASEFHLSQTKSYVSGKFYRDAFTEGAVRSGAKCRLVLKPS